MVVLVPFPESVMVTGPYNNNNNNNNNDCYVFNNNNLESLVKGVDRSSDL